MPAINLIYDSGCLTAEISENTRITYIEERKEIRVIQVSTGNVLRTDHFPEFTFSLFIEKIRRYREIFTSK